MNQETNINQKCGSIVNKIAAGHHLAEAEKAHLAECENCMMKLLEALDKRKTATGAVSDEERARPAAKRALERGRLVFEREFGISLSTVQTPGQNGR